MANSKVVQTIESRRRMLQQLLEKVKSHPWCTRFSETANFFYVFYPKDAHPVHQGIRVPKGQHKLKSVYYMYQAIQQHYGEVFPEEASQLDITTKENHNERNQ